MQLDEHNKAYLWDIVDACNDILEFTKDTSSGVDPFVKTHFQEN